MVRSEHLEEMPFSDVAFFTYARVIGVHPFQLPKRLCVEADFGNGKDFRLEGEATDCSFFYVQPETGLEIHLIFD